MCRGGRVVDLGGGHGLLAHVLLLLDDTSLGALVVDPTLAPSHQRLHQELVALWPRLDGRVTFVECSIDEVAAAAGDLIVSCHGCGRLTDAALDLALDARARVAVLPCCHDHVHCETGELAGWMPADLAIDATRGGATPPARVSHLDEDDSGRGHASQPAADRGADRRGVRTAAAARPAAAGLLRGALDLLDHVLARAPLSGGLHRDLGAGLVDGGFVGDHGAPSSATS